MKRTTVNLPDDLFREVKLTATAAGSTVTRFLEDALREALARRRSAITRSRFTTVTFGGGSGQRTPAGIDEHDSSALLDWAERTGLDANA